MSSKYPSHGRKYPLNRSKRPDCTNCSHSQPDQVLRVSRQLLLMNEAFFGYQGYWRDLSTDKIMAKVMFVGAMSFGCVLVRNGQTYIGEGVLLGKDEVAAVTSFTPKSKITFHSNSYPNHVAGVLILSVEVQTVRHVYINSALFVNADIKVTRRFR